MMRSFVFKPYQYFPLRCAMPMALILALAVTVSATAATEDPGGSPVAVVDNAALDNAVLALVEFAPADANGTPVVIEQGARVRHDLGAVIDPRPADGGLPRVMAVTPGGAAERMDLRSGDRLLRVNGTELAADETAARLLRDAVQNERATIDLHVQRGSEQLAISGAVDRVDVPAYRLAVTPVAARAGCGRINLVLKPPLRESLFPVLLHTIDGRLGGALINNVYRVSAGRHVLKVSELIPNDRFWGGDNNHRRQLLRNERFKYLELDVQPNMTYRLGLRYFKDKTTRIRDQDYWEPVVWKEVSESCR